MSGTAFNGLAAALVALLIAGTPVADSVGRSRPRSRPVAEQDETAVVVRLAGADSDLGAIQFGPRNWETLIAVEIYGHSVGALTGEELVDPVLYEVQSRIAANPSLGIAGVDCELKSLRWDVSAESDKAGAVTAVFRVLHQTANHNLS